MQIPGLSIIITARPNVLRNFRSKMPTYTEEVILAGMTTPTECLDTFCAAIQFKMELSSRVLYDGADAVVQALGAKLLKESAVVSEKLPAGSRAFVRGIFIPKCSTEGDTPL